MRTRLTDDELAIREVFAEFFARECPTEVVRAAEPSGHDADLWRRLSATGAPGMAVAADRGGGDADLRTLAVVVEQSGAHLAPVPLVEHAVTARLLAADGSRDDLVAAAVAGERIATLALRSPADGRARLVPAGAAADIVVAHVGGRLVVTEGDPPPAAPTTGDLPLADRDLTAATPLGGHAGHAWDRALDEWRALMAVAYTGLARRAIEICVGYVTEREQFGVPVGSFQAVQHGLADAATRVEGAALLAQRAVWALDTHRPDGPRLAAMALLFCAEVGRFATDRALQYHGGYGYAEEYDIQLYHRRATSWTLQLGDPALEYARLADLELGPRQPSTGSDA
mgnify:CR=1 FL=1